MTIQWMPEYFNKPRESTSSRIGEALGNTISGATNLYLQNKIQGYFDQQKQAELGRQQTSSGNALAQALGTPEKAQSFSQLPISMQQAFIKPMMQGKGIGGIGAIGGKDYTSAFTGVGQPLPINSQSNVQPGTGNVQAPISNEQPLPTTNANLSPERQARAAQNEEYQTENEQLNPQEGNPQEPPGEVEAPMTEDQIRNDWKNSQDANDNLRKQLLQQNPQDAQNINNAYAAATKENKDRADQLMELNKGKIARETGTIKAQDEKTKKAIEKVETKADNAMAILSRLDDLDKLIDEPTTGYTEASALGFTPGSFARGLIPFGLGKGLGNLMDQPSGAADIRGAYDEIALMNLEVFKGALSRGISNQEEYKRYSHVISSSEDFPSQAKRKNAALRKLLQRDIKKKELYDSIQNPDGTYPKNASKLVHQLMKEGDGQLNKEVDKTVKDVTLAPGSIYMKSPDGRIGSVPKEKIKEAEGMGYIRQ